MKYGVKIADLIRNTNTSQFSLLYPFYKNRKDWITNVRPLMESAQHQTAIMSVGRYSDDDYKKTYSIYNNSEDINNEFKFDNSINYSKTFSNHQQFDDIIFNVSQNPDQAVVRLYSRPWKLQQNKSQTEEFKKFIASSKGLITHSFFTESHLPVCDKVVEILLVIDVPTCLKFKDNGSY